MNKLLSFKEINVQNELKFKSLDNIYARNYVKLWTYLLIHLEFKSYKSIGSIVALFKKLDVDLFIKSLVDFIKYNTCHIKLMQHTSNEMINNIIKFSKNKELQELFNIRQNNYINFLMQIENKNSDILQLTKKSNPIEKLYNISKKLPYPINQWLDSIIKDSWNIISKKYQIKLSKKWEHIQKMYLLSDEHNSWINFYKNKEVISFFKKFIRPITTAINGKLYPIKTYPFTFNWIKKYLNFFNNFIYIKNTYFLNNKLRHINIEIAPYYLDKNLKLVKLNCDNKVVVYRHGPQFSTLIPWPPKKENSNCKLLIDNFNNHHFYINYNGTFALFKLLNINSKLIEANNHTLIWKKDINNYYIFFKLYLNFNKNMINHYKQLHLLYKEFIKKGENNA